MHLVQRNKQYRHRKVLLSSSHLSGHTLRFRQTQNHLIQFNKQNEKKKPQDFILHKHERFGY